MRAQRVGPVSAFKGASEVVGVRWSNKLSKMQNGRISKAEWFVVEGTGVSFSSDSIDFDVTKVLVNFDAIDHVAFGVRVFFSNGRQDIALIRAYILESGIVTSTG